jgi:hypothetical protein
MIFNFANVPPALRETGDRQLLPRWAALALVAMIVPLPGHGDFNDLYSRRCA